MAGKRVVFTFDEKSYADLKSIAAERYSGSMAETVRESLAVREALQSQADQGYSEIVVRDPDTGKERVMVTPALK